MNSQLFGTLKMGQRFHYYGDHEHIYTKVGWDIAQGEGGNGPVIYPGDGVLVFPFDYYQNDNLNSHIGYLRNGRFICHYCNDKYDYETDVHVYLVNVAPYKQSCHECKRLVVLGKTPAWCELWD